MVGWKETTLANICQIKPPKKEAKEKLSDQDMVSFVPMNNLGICSKSIHLSEDKALKEVAGSYTYFADNDVLLAKITPCFENGKLGIATGLTNGVGFGSSEFIVFRSKGSVDPEYLFYFLSQDKFRVSGARVMSGAVGHKRVPKEFIENHPVLLPPLSEQKRIVAILDEALAGIDAAATNTEKNLANARELLESYLNGVFTRKGEGWVEKKLGEYSTSISTGPFGSLLHKSDYVSTGVPLVNPINIIGRNIVPNSSKLIDEEMKNKLRSYVLHQGDIVIARRGEIGRCAVINSEHDGWVCGTGCFFMQPLPSVNPHFLANLFHSQRYREKLEKVATGATMKNLSNKTLSNFPVSIPNIEKQIEILAKFDELALQTQHLESINQQKLSALAELKQAILQKAFAGELTARPDQALAEAVA